MASFYDPQLDVITSRFQVGSKVRYTSGAYGEDSRNPMWGGRYGYQIGIVTRLLELESGYEVSWATGNNAYKEHDLDSVIGGIAPE